MGGRRSGGARRDRRSLLAAVTVAVLALGPLAVVVPAQAQVTAAPSVRATRDAQQPATPPADAMGSPSASTVVTADDLFIEQREGATTFSATTAIPDGGGAAVSGTERFRADLDPQTSTAAGRFLDPGRAVPAIPGFDASASPDPERVASLRHQDTGGDGILALTYRFPAAGPGGATLARGAALQAGGTYAFSPLSSGAGSGTYLAAPAQQPQGFGAGVTTVRSPGSAVPVAAGQWSLVSAAGANGPNVFSLVNRADGTCLDVLAQSMSPGALVDAYPCNGGANQQWAVFPPSGGTTSLQSVQSGLLLTAGPGGFTQETGSSGSGTPSQTFATDAIQEPQGVVPTVGIPQARDESLPSALATGDLDRSVDSIGRYRDESVVAWADEDRTLNVAVADHNANASHVLLSQTSLGVTVGAAGFPGSVGVAIGDFDGAPDSRDEIAVTWQDSGGTIHASLLRYTADGTGASDGFGGGRTLTVAVPDTGPRVGAAGFPDAASLVGGFGHAAAGDLLNSGHQQLVVTWADDGGTGNATEVGNAHVGAFSFGTDLSVAAVSALTLTADDLSATVYGNVVRQGLPVATGLFKYGPTDTVATSYPLTRRQVVVGWGSQNRANFQTVDAVLGADGTSFSLVPLSQPVYLDQVTPGELAPGRPIALAAGGYAGQGTPDQVPLWGIAATSTPMNSPPVTTRWSIDPGSFRAVGGAVVPVGSSPGDEADVTLTAFDQRDRSLRVGAPLTLTVENQPAVQVLGAEPPTHADYLPGNRLADADGFVNVDREYGFALTLGQSTTSDTTAAYQTSKTGTVGTADSLDVKATYKAGVPGVALKSSLDSTTKFQLQNSSTSATSGSYSTQKSKMQTATTNDDDVLFYHSQSSVIYRYPILGGQQTSGGQPVTDQPCSPTCYGFYDVLVPLSVSEQSVVTGTGIDASVGYNPSWQNGNALSYPPTPDTADSGVFTVPGNPVPVTIDPTPVAYSVGRDASSATLDVAASTGSGFGSSSSLSWNLDETVTGAVQVKLGLPEESVTGSVTASLGVNGGQTLSSSVQGTSTNSTDSSFTVAVPALAQDTEYGAQSSSYYSTSGAFKTVHGVQVPTNAARPGAAFWTGAYAAPDPALNLPLALDVVPPNNVTQNPTVSFERGADRQALRGFEVRQPADGSGSLTDGTPYAPGENPVAGTPVTFAAPVGNYSVLGTSSAGTVDFLAVPSDALFSTNTGPAITIGRSTLPPLTPGQQTTVVSPSWTAPAGTGTQNYRVFVQVNRDGGQSETHPLNGAPCPAADGLVDPLTGQAETLACGQNNQGWGELTVTPAPLSSTGLGATRGADVRPVGATFRLDPAADRLDAARGPARVTEGQRIHGQVQFTAEADTAVNQPVEIYDGPPSEGNLIAVTTLRAADAGAQREAEYRWTPQGVGRHQLHQVVRSATGGGDTWTQVVDVDVVAASSGGGSGGNGGGGNGGGGNGSGGDGSGGVPTAGPTSPAVPGGAGSTTPDALAPDGSAGSRPGGLASTGARNLGLLVLVGAALVATGTVLVRRRRRGA